MVSAAIRCSVSLMIERLWVLGIPQRVASAMRSAPVIVVRSDRPLTVIAGRTRSFGHKTVGTTSYAGARVI